jgi:hypothetical protein
MTDFTKTEAYLQLALVTIRPFVLEYEGDFQNAIVGHGTASKTLNDLMAAIKKNMRKFQRKMFERQAEVHTQRRKYLESFKRDFKGVVVPPTIRSADAELIVAEGQIRPLSLVGVWFD